MDFRSFITIYLVLVIYTADGQKVPVVLHTNVEQMIDLTPFTTFYHDDSGQLGIDEILKSDIQFRKNQENEELINYPSSMWYCIPVCSQITIEDKWLLLGGRYSENIYTSYIDYVEVYYVRNQHVLNHFTTGLRIPKREKAIKEKASLTSVPFNIKARDTLTVFILLKGASKQHNPFSSIYITDPNINHSNTEEVVTWFFHSVLAMFLIIGIYVSIFYFFVRHQSYLLFAAFCLLYSIHHLHIFPFSNLVDLFFQEKPFLAEPIHAFAEWGSTFTLLLFGYSFTNVKIILPKWGLYYRILLVIYLILSILGVYQFMFEPYPVEKGNFTIALIMVLPVAIRLLFHASKLAKIFAFGILWFVLWRIVGNATMIRPFFALGQIGLLLIYALGLGIKLRENEQQRALSDQVKQLDSIKSKFFANISHEFRTPLTLILTPLSKLLAPYTPGEKLNDEKLLPVKGKNVKMMHRNALRLLHLINQILDLSKLDQRKMHLHLKKGSLITHIRSILTSFSSIAENKNINYLIDVDDFINEGYFDKDKMEIIISNLLSNAFKYTPENGTVRVNVGMQDDMLLLRVEDTGKGISSDELNKIFERYYQVEIDNDLGSGIGLALVKELVDLYKGTIRVSSHINKGTTFEIQLPIHNTAPKSSSEISTLGGKLSVAEILNEPNPKEDLNLKGQSIGAKPIVLIVEDNPEIRNYISEELQDNFTIYTAENGKIGMDKALNILPDLIISDIMMPVMNGLEMCHEIKSLEKTSHIPIIIITAKAGHESKMDGLKIGADDYLVKPFDSRELNLKVENIIQQMRRLREKYKKTILITPEQTDFMSLDEKFLNKVVSIIDKGHSNENFSVEILADKVGFSSSQLNRKLKALLNISTNQLIRHYRLTRAKDLIEKKVANVSEIAYMVGFNNLSYFSKSYKKKFGVLPSDTKLNQKLLDT